MHGTTDAVYYAREEIALSTGSRDARPEVVEGGNRHFHFEYVAFERGCAGVLSRGIARLRTLNWSICVKESVYIEILR